MTLILSWLRCFTQISVFLERNDAEFSNQVGLCLCVLLSTQVAETRCKKVCTSKSDLRTNDFSIVGSLPRDFELSNFDCYGKPIDTGSGLGKSQAKNNKRPPPPKPVIPSAAKRVDLYSRALFPFSFLFFNVIYWSIYLWLSSNDLVLSTTFPHRHKFLNYQSELKEMWNLPIQNDFWESLYITIIVIFNLKKHTHCDHLCIKKNHSNSVFLIFPKN